MQRIGVLGGMGPSATVDFMGKIIQLTPASCDQEHLPVVVANLPHVPDRSRAILGLGPDPLPALLEGIDVLNTANVGVIAIPCNSSHHWYAQMAERSRCEVIHIAKACVEAVPAVGNTKVAIFATRGAITSGFYQHYLQERGIAYFVPDASSGQSDIDECIRSIKAGSMQAGAKSLQQALVCVAAHGVSAVIMGCTEIPIAANVMGQSDITLIDSTLELARATVSYALHKGWNKAPCIS
jgi:aspartate racemase